MWLQCPVQRQTLEGCVRFWGLRITAWDVKQSPGSSCNSSIRTPHPTSNTPLLCRGGRSGSALLTRFQVGLSPRSCIESQHGVGFPTLGAAAPSPIRMGGPWGRTGMKNRSLGTAGAGLAPGQRGQEILQLAEAKADRQVPPGSFQQLPPL